MATRRPPTSTNQDEVGNKTKRVLLAGATGTLGKELIRALTGSHAVTALARHGSETKLEAAAPDLSSIRLGEVTDQSAIRGLCDDIDLVVTTVGITRQKDGLTYDQVDYQANLNLLREAERAGASSFVYVSVVGADQPSSVPAIDAKHRFEQELMASSVDWLIIRPSGFFTDLLEVLAMARRGTVWHFGSGDNRISPIDVADLADAIVSNLHRRNEAIDIGGPENLTWNEIARICFTTVGKRTRIIHLPRAILRLMLTVTKPFSPTKYGVLSFVGHIQTQDTTAPNVGTRSLDQFMNAHG